MASESPLDLRTVMQRSRGFLFPILIVVSVLVIVTPLPPLLMDFLLASNVTIAVLILLTTIYVTRPLDFNVFPALLLGTTLARLVLNVASTRLILSRGGTDGVSGAGGVIEAFGSFVAGNNIVIGLIIFVILVVIQFLVITKGATRISEVTARFTLDAMPAKQMAIDADLGAKLIDQEEAKARREEVAAEADFYGAMDGASKFVRGDSVASIVITLINIVGGLYVGMIENGMPFGDAVRVFTTLTIGDGLVTQVPGFLISLAAALVVTRSSQKSDLSAEVVKQLFRHSEAMFLAAAFLLCLSMTGLPLLPMLGLASGCVAVGLVLRRQKQESQQEATAEEEAAAQRPDAEPDEMENLLVDPLELELGSSLVLLVDPEHDGDLLQQITQVRLLIAEELGLVMPKVRVRDHDRPQARQYRIKLRGVPIAEGEVYPDGMLAIDMGMVSSKIPGVATREPAFGRPAVWIEPAQAEYAERLGYEVYEPTVSMAMHLSELVREHAAELLSRQQVHQLLEHLKERSEQLVEELVPDVLKTAQVQQVLAALLDERIPIRDLETILETLGNFAERAQFKIPMLTELVRSALARTICELHRDERRKLRVATLDPGWQEVLRQGFGDDVSNPKPLPPNVGDMLISAIATAADHMTTLGTPQVLLVDASFRPSIRQLTRSRLPKLSVLSVMEITRDTQVQAVASVAIPQQATPNVPVGAT